MTMLLEQSVTTVLNEAMQALALLDLNKLEELQARIAALDRCDDAVAEKRQLLAMLLQNCKSNLDALNRLQSRNMGGTWAH